MGDSREETSLEPSLELGRTKKPKLLCEHSKIFLTWGRQPNRHDTPYSSEPFQNFPTTALQQALVLQVKLEPT